MSTPNPTAHVPHESAAYHVTGHASYVDDLLVNAQLLHGHVYTSPHAHARILRFDLSAARKCPGVLAVLSHQDLPGHNDMGPIIHDEPVLAEGTVTFVGQAIFLIAAENERAALQAAKCIEIEYELLPAIVTLEEAIRQDTRLQPSRLIAAGDAKAAMAQAPLRISGTLRTGAQEHWYLETQSCVVVPGEGDDLKAYSSTQHPSETQALVAEVLGIHKMNVEVEVRRMGGGFGGKETQANHPAIWAALLARATHRPVKVRLFRDDDQKMTGKRHPFLSEYEAGFDGTGRILALDAVLHADGGAATDLTMAVLERAMMHIDNAYFLPNVCIVGHARKTNLPSNTAFRGFGGPQGVAVIEQVIDRIARLLNMDPMEVRRRNFYKEGETTPYGQPVQLNRMPLLDAQLTASSDYQQRRASITQYNAQHPFKKRGLAMTPVKFGISFTTAFLNQAGALVNIYSDGTVLVNHGGTEMGQGLHTKMRQIAALELGLGLDRVKVNATNTSKVPNTSATAASAGTDLNGAAVKDAVTQLKARMVPVALRHFNASNPEVLSLAENIEAMDGHFRDSAHPERSIDFPALCAQCVFQQVSLSATGFYRTPEVFFDRAKGKGKPYHYFSYGMGVTEIELDTLTGHVQLLRTDLLHDVGDSINPAIDIGQVEGAYVQGLGWVTTEECKWNEKGHLLNHSPDTYKIPNIQDIAPDFRTGLLQGVPNPNTVRRSKAVAEPPFMLAFSAWLAIKDAISAVGDHQFEPDFQIPATNEFILESLEKVRMQVKAASGK